MNSINTKTQGQSFKKYCCLHLVRLYQISVSGLGLSRAKSKEIYQQRLLWNRSLKMSTSAHKWLTWRFSVGFSSTFADPSLFNLKIQQMSILYLQEPLFFLQNILPAPLFPEKYNIGLSMIGIFKTKANHLWSCHSLTSDEIVCVFYIL